MGLAGLPRGESRRKGVVRMGGKKINLCVIFPSCRAGSCANCSRGLPGGAHGRGVDSFFDIPKCKPSRVKVTIVGGEESHSLGKAFFSRLRQKNCFSSVRPVLGVQLQGSEPRGRRG